MKVFVGKNTSGQTVAIAMANIDSVVVGNIDASVVTKMAKNDIELTVESAQRLIAMWQEAES